MIRAIIGLVLLAACSSNPPPTPAEDAPGLDAAEAAPCGGGCGAGQVCELGRCVAVIGPDAAAAEAGVDALEVGPDAAPDVQPGSDVPVDTCVSSDPANCCGVRCRTLRHAGTPACVRGVCGTVCDPNFGDCDGNAANGCEVDLRGDVSNCGICGRSCPSGQVCANGNCAARCPAGLADCNGSCRSLSSDPDNCGRCNARCEARPHAVANGCGAPCSYRCDDGFRDCDGDAANGCETESEFDPAHCGACGTRCAEDMRCVNFVCVH